MSDICNRRFVRTNKFDFLFYEKMCVPIDPEDVDARVHIYRDLGEIQRISQEACAYCGKKVVFEVNQEGDQDD